MRAVVAAVLALSLVAAAPAARTTDRTLSTTVLTATLILSADSAGIKQAGTPAALGKAAAKLKSDAQAWTRRVAREKPSSAAGTRCRRAALATFARFVSASSSFSAFVAKNKKGDQVGAKTAYERGKRQLDAALGQLSAAAKLAAALR